MDSLSNGKPIQEAKRHESARGLGRILVVEDDADVRNLAVSQLLDLGYQVEEAENANSALSKLSEDQPVDLLFTGVAMSGGMSGLELWRHAEPRQPGLKVIFTSGHSDDVISPSDSLANNFHFLRNPPVPHDLPQVVRNTLARGAN